MKRLTVAGFQELISQGVPALTLEDEDGNKYALDYMDLLVAGWDRHIGDRTPAAEQSK